MLDTLKSALHRKDSDATEKVPLLSSEKKHSEKRTHRKHPEHVSLHRTPEMIQAREHCLSLARMYLDPSARKVKIQKRYQQNGTGVMYYSAHVVNAAEQVIIETGHGPDKFYKTEEEAVSVLSTVLYEEWREKQETNVL